MPDCILEPQKSPLLKHDTGLHTPFHALCSAGRIRTYNQLLNRELRYRCATAECAPKYSQKRPARNCGRKRYLRIAFSTLAIAIVVLMMESGLRDMLSIPCSTRNFAKDGWSEGPWPQMPTYFFFLRHTLMTSAMSFFTAALFSSATRFTMPESRSSPSVSWVRSLEPIDMPSNSFRNSSARMALEGISHMTMTGVAVFFCEPFAESRG